MLAEVRPSRTSASATTTKGGLGGSGGEGGTNLKNAKQPRKSLRAAPRGVSQLPPTDSAPNLGPGWGPKGADPVSSRFRAHLPVFSAQAEQNLDRLETVCNNLAPKRRRPASAPAQNASPWPRNGRWSCWVRKFRSGGLRFFFAQFSKRIPPRPIFPITSLANSRLTPDFTPHPGLKSLPPCSPVFWHLF